MPKYRVTAKVVNRNDKGIVQGSTSCNWTGVAASESEAIAKARKSFESSHKDKLRNGRVLEDLIAKPM